MKRIALAAALTGALLSSGRARADDADEATRLYVEGSTLATQHRCGDAIGPLERSDALLPSPNTTLLIARCLEELGRDEEAAERFERAMVDAQLRAGNGEPRYARTAVTARIEGTAARLRLGTLRVRVTPALPRTVVETDRGDRAVGEDGFLELLHRPGEVRVTVRAPDRAPATRVVTVSAGRWTTLEINLPAAALPAPPPPVSSRTSPDVMPPPRRRSWQRPLGFALAGVGVAGGGLFAGFGLDARSRYDALDACAPGCGAAERSSADAGERSQRIANVALVGGALALATGLVLLLAAP